MKTVLRLHLEKSLTHLHFSWNANTLAIWCEELTYMKRPWCWERLKAGEEDDGGWDDWMASPTRWTWVWVNSGFFDGQEGLVCYSSWGCKESDTTEWLNWTDPVLHTIFLINYIFEGFFIFGYDNTSLTKFWMFDILR